MPENGEKMVIIWCYLPKHNIFLICSYVCINKGMRNYTALDIQRMFHAQKDSVSHVIVAHTYFHTYRKTARQVQLMADEGKKGCRHALNCFSKLLYPTATNKPVRQPHIYRPLSLVTIEGLQQNDTDKALTIHFNICLGNLPSILTTEDIGTLFRHAWHDKAQLADDIAVLDYYDKNSGRWMGYSLKEAQQTQQMAWATEGTWDVLNCWIPANAAHRAD